MDNRELNEFIEKTIKDAGNVDRMNLKTMLRLLPQLIEYYAENDSQKEVLDKALDGGRDSFDELAEKFDASPEEQEAFQNYIKYNQMRRMAREKERNEMLQKSTAEGEGFERSYPHIWFSMELKKINKILKYLSVLKMQKGYYDYNPKSKTSLSLKVGAMQIRMQGNDFQLIVPVISGSFIKNGAQTNFSYKYILATYVHDEIYYEASLYENGLKTSVHGKQEKSCFSESNIAIDDSDFQEHLRRFPEVIGNVDIKMESKGANLQVKTVLKRDGRDAVCFQLYINTKNDSDISYTTQIHCPTNMLYIRKAPILYRAVREIIIDQFKKYELKEADRIVVDDMNGVTITDHLHLKMGGLRVNFFHFHVKLNPEERAIEIWVKGEVRIIGVYHNIELRTRVFYDVICETDRFRTLVRMTKNKNYWVWADARTSCVENEIKENGEKVCREVEKALDRIVFEWQYPFLFNFSDIQLYDKNGYLSLKYSLDI